MHVESVVAALMPLFLPDTQQALQNSNINFAVLVPTVMGTVTMQVEISLQPWRAFKPDGVILFSDILTPLTGMGIPFDIEAGRGPVIHDPIRTMQVCSLFLDVCKVLHRKR